MHFNQIGVLRAVIWLAAATAIGFPNITQHIANAAGIDRGADLVFYAFVLAFLGTTFYFYGRHVKAERQLTELVRQLALERAQRGCEPASRPERQA